MKEKLKISPEGFKSRLGLWLAGIVLILVIVGLVLYLFSLSLAGVRAARQAYFDQVAALKKQEVEVTIIEGWRREQIAVLLEKKGIILVEEFMAATKDLEGQLFPDTYRFFPGSGAQEVVAKFTNNFQTKAKALGTIDQDTLILASIVEREAAGDAERSKIAGVYKNRLEADIMLEADPTTQYARDSEAISKIKNFRQFDFWQPISGPDTQKFKSDYNTYQSKGLPPAPIANPGLKSIEASLKPEKHDYFYFFHSQDGSIIFSKTLDEHNQNKRIYGVRSTD